MTNQMDTNVTMTTIELLEFDNVKGYIDPHGRAMLLADDIARELGFVDNHIRKICATSGAKEYHASTIRWQRINQYLAEYGFPPTGRGQYLPEDAVYYLAIKANNEKAKEFHRLLVRVIIPHFRETVNRKQMEMMKQQLAQKEKLVEQAKYAMDYYQEAVEDDVQTVPLSVIADNYGMTPQALNTLLYHLGFHHPIGDGWVINEQYKDQGLVKTRKGRARNQVGIFDFITGYTEKGRYLINDLITKNANNNTMYNNGSYNTYNNYQQPQFLAPPLPAPGQGHPIIYNTEQYCPNIKPGTICPLIFSDTRLNAQFK